MALTWEDKEVSFDVPFAEMRLKLGEKVIDKLDNIEDTKGNAGDRGRMIITNLRILWHSMTSPRVNLLKELQTKWKSLRDQFKKEVNLERITKSGEPSKKKKKYVYYHHLQFLKKFLDTRQNTSNSEDGNFNEDTEDSQNLEDNEKTDDQPIHRRAILKRDKQKMRVSTMSNVSNDFEDNIKKEITSMLSESVAPQKHYSLDDIMGNKAFLMSLLPIMDEMTLDQAFYVRLKVMELLHELRTSNYQPFHNTSFQN